MARNLTAAFITEATANSNRPIVLYEGVFASSTVRLWNGYGDLSWNSQTWLGNGWFQGMEGGDETDEVEATDMGIVLSAVPSEVMSLVLGNQKQGALGKLYIGFLNSVGAVIADPYLWWQGKYSHSEISEGGDQSIVTIHYESLLVDLNRAKELRWTHEFQQKLFPGDRGFEYVQAAANWHGNWGIQKKQGKDNKKKTNKPKGSGGKNKGSKRRK